ncbi:probable cytochrome P450 6a23 [Choristoneura fumiferana]|uniref:probable cytochrome P450 6a23 n=1 Tax=Choristoneura fumiferana TaxID=7141 RepID=UPI003D15DB74
MNKMFGFKRCSVQLLVLLSWCMEYWTFGYVFLWYLFACAVFISFLLVVLTYDHDYWTNRGIFSPPAFPLVGHILSVVLFKEQGGMCFKRIYNKYRGLKFLGTHQFFQRTLVIRDPALIKRVCVTDFAYFVDRGFFFNEEVDPLAGSVLFLRGQEWRRLRAKISPIFSPNKLKGMFPIIENTAQEFLKRVAALPTRAGAEHVKINDEDAVLVDSEKLVGGYTADAIVPCAFGVKSQVMDDDNDPFAVALQAFYEMSLSGLFEKTMRQFWPAFSLFFRMKIIPQKTHDFFYNIVTSVLRDRENGVVERRGDFIDMMMALRNDDKNNNKAEKDEDYVEITDMVISANAFIIFLGGFETTSSTLAFLLLELAANPEVQEKMRREIQDVLGERELTYEVLHELEYMEMVIQETLRLYPPFPSIQRQCTRDYTIPETGYVVEKGTIVLFPTLAIQRDEQYWPAAGSFIPERWSGPAPPPGVYMPFGDGPRYCIGKRFAMIQMKCCLARLLQRVRVSPAPFAEPRSEPFEPDPRSPLTLHPKDSRITISFIR